MCRTLASQLSALGALSVILIGSATLSCQKSPAKASAAGSTEAPRLTFDVASIHLFSEGGPRYYENVPRSSLYKAVGVPLRSLIDNAYGVKIRARLHGLPEWANTTLYTLTAKSDEKADAA
jgi:hypothetical protein